MNKKQATLMQYLTLLAAVPMIALILASGTLIWDSFSRYQNALQAHDIMDVAVAAGDLIHPIQTERGYTAGFIQSKGTKFAEILPGIRTQTDQKMADYKRLLAGIDTDSMPHLKQAVEAAQGKLAEMVLMRDQANQFAIPAGEASAFFTSTIGELLEVMSTAAEYNSDPAIGKKLLTYHNFSNAKENAGQERALTTPAFVANKVEPAQYRAILTRINKQESYLDSFTDSATEQEKAALKAALNGDAAQDVQRMRNIMAERSVQGGFDVDSAVWLKRITDKINGLHEVEQLVTNNIDADVTRSLSSSRTLLVTQLALAALAIVISIALSLWVARRVNQSLSSVVNAAEYAVEHDDFTHAIPEVGMQETARVGQAFNRLTGKFRDIIGETTRSSEGIAEATGELTVVSDQVNKSSSAQADAAASVAASIEEVTVSVSETAANARAAGEIVDKARAGTEDALTVMASTVQNVNSIATLIKESGNKVARLDDSSKKIGGIVHVIREVADQTNLLALNAAIEAARAGEQGRGFAVVADEVRKLAERTSNATTEIASLIGDIQSHIGDTVTGMQHANSQIEESLNLASKTGEVVQRIGTDSREMAVNVQNIIDAVHEQDIAIQQVAINIEKIAQMAEENSAAAASSSDTAARLDELTGALHKSVHRFKI